MIASLQGERIQGRWTYSQVYTHIQRRKDAGLVYRGMINMVASIQGEQYHIQGRSTYSQAYTEEEGLHNLYTMYILYRGWIYRVASKQGKYTG